jgi:hypothetical protein
MTLDEIFAKYDDMDMVGIPSDYVKHIETEHAKIKCGWVICALKKHIEIIEKYKEKDPEFYNYEVERLGLNKDTWELFHE